MPFRKLPHSRKKVKVKRPHRPKHYKHKNLKEHRKQTLRTGKPFSHKRDAERKARRPGYRRSKNGKIYYEARRNRSDRSGSRI